MAASAAVPSHAARTEVCPGVPPRATKIVATLGPASDGRVAELLAAGVDVFRLNLSHGTHAEHAARIDLIRAESTRLGRYVAIMADLQGPKIRIRGFAQPGPVTLCRGACFAIDAALDDLSGSVDRVGTTYARLPSEVVPGDLLVLGDGLIELEVTGVHSGRVDCRVAAGGDLAAGQGINKRGGGLSADALTEKDRTDLAFACSKSVDYIAVSFPRAAADIDMARALITEQGGNCGLVAKIERAEAVADDTALDALVLASDAVMVARGDLGIEIGDAALVGVQKRIIARARALGRSVITATQMMESMTKNPRPTRAEVMDVANAVLDGTDAVMLSGETAVGCHPVAAVRSMSEVVRGAEGSDAPSADAERPGDCDSVDASLALAAMTVADTLSGVAAVACLTASGNTPRLMSRARSRLPIYAMAHSPSTLARVALIRGVHPVLFETEGVDFDLVNEAAIAWLTQHGIVSFGDRVILSKGDYRDVQGGTNTLKIMEVR